MNERIRELARRVVGKRRDDAGPIWLVDEQIEKLAEMIVLKCAVIATRCESNGTKNIGAEILEHFGVE